MDTLGHITHALERTIRGRCTSAKRLNLKHTLETQYYELYNTIGQVLIECLIVASLLPNAAIASPTFYMDHK